MYETGCLRHTDPVSRGPPISAGIKCTGPEPTAFWSRLQPWKDTVGYDLIAGAGAKCGSHASICEPQIVKHGAHTNRLSRQLP
jgi:hypothetical protein